MFLRTRTEFFGGGVSSFLHVAPEPFFVTIFKEAVGQGYISGDLFSHDAMEKMDITKIQHPAASFDAVYCSHVLEHVVDDRKAMSELYRVLKPNGWAILNVPITTDETFEDPSVIDPEERRLIFGQRDHVRRYGPDYVDRLKSVGFDVVRFVPSDLLSDATILKYGLSGEGTGEIFYCTKRDGDVRQAPLVAEQSEDSR